MHILIATRKLSSPAVSRELEEEEEEREEAVKVREQAILLLGKVLAQHGFAEGE